MKKHILKLVITSIVVLGALAFYFLQTVKPKTWPDALTEYLGGPPEMSKVDPAKSLEGQTRTLELAGRTFDVPIMYIDSRPDPGVHQTGLLLKVIWPEMRSLFHIHDRAEYQRIVEERTFGSILIEPAAARPSLDEQDSNARRLVDREDALPSEHALEKYLWFKKRPDALVPTDEVYLLKDAGQRIVTRIECDPDKLGYLPQCKHKFVDGGLVYQLRYNKAQFLSAWREQQSRAIEFLRRMEKTNEPMIQGEPNANIKPNSN